MRAGLSAYQRYALTVLLVVNMLNLLDRQIMNILAEPIKIEFGLPDWQIGALTGFAFALFYSVLGVPIARLAERGHRPRIIAACTAIWSLFTALCGLALNAWQLALARIGVGVGEAGCTPPAMSLIADTVPPERRASAIAFFQLGTPIGFLIGMALGGIVADAWGWRHAFLITGLPGLAVALVAALTLTEPRPPQPRAKATGPSLRETLALLAAKPTFLLLVAAVALKAMIGSGQSPFTASFLLRNHAQEIAGIAAGFGLKPTGFTGLALGLVGGTSGLLGIWAGGLIGDRYGARDPRAYLAIPMIASLVAIPCCIAAMTAPSLIPALLLLASQGVVNGLWYGPVYAAVLSIVPAASRATTAAILLLAVNLVGFGIGPVVVGLISDTLAGPFGYGSAEGLRWALVLNSFPGVVAAWLFFAARRRLPRDFVG